MNKAAFQRDLAIVSSAAALGALIGATSENAADWNRAPKAPRDIVVFAKKCDAFLTNLRQKVGGNKSAADSLLIAEGRGVIDYLEGRDAAFDKIKDLSPELAVLRKEHDLLRPKIIAYRESHKNYMKEAFKRAGKNSRRGAAKGSLAAGALTLAALKTRRALADRRARARTSPRRGVRGK